MQNKNSKAVYKEEALYATTTKPHNSTSPGAKNEMSHGKPSLANHIMRFICTTFRFALLGFGKYFAGSTQTAVVSRATCTCTRSLLEKMASIDVLSHLARILITTWKDPSIQGNVAVPLNTIA